MNADFKTFIERKIYNLHFFIDIKIKIGKNKIIIKYIIFFFIIIIYNILSYQYNINIKKIQFGDENIWFYNQ